MPTLLPLAFALGVPTPRPLPVPAAPVRVVRAWPPPGADPSRIWIEGVSSGPLGRAPDRLFERIFRQRLAAELGRDAADPTFRGIVDLARALVAERGPDVALASRRVLNECFPDWPPVAARRLLPASVCGDVRATGRKGLLFWFEVLFARPFPAFSGRLNAWVTSWAAQWLMGPCSLEGLAPEDVADVPSNLCGGAGAQVLVHRCRFLEESACASICVNACKIPTQAFFNEEMGVPMRMEPDYETLECRFKFGLRPSAADEEEARSVACFSACPSNGLLRQQLEGEASGARRCSAMGGPTVLRGEGEEEPS